MRRSRSFNVKVASAVNDRVFENKVSQIKAAQNPADQVAKMRPNVFKKPALKGVKIVDKLTKLPGRITDFGERLNDEIINKAQDIKNATDSFANESTKVAEENLKRNKINSLARRAADWLQSNPMVATGVALVGVFVIFKAFK